MIDTKKIAAFFVGALLLFSAVVSGSIYPAALMTFTVAIVIVFLVSLSDPERSNLLSLWPAWLLLLVTYASAFWTVNLNDTLMLAFAMSAYIVFASVAAYAAEGERKRVILTVVFIAAALISGGRRTHKAKGGRPGRLLPLRRARLLRHHDAGQEAF